MRLRRGDEDLGPVEHAVTVVTRARGLLGRTGVDGAMLLSPASSVHTIGMRFAIDVAHLDADMRVLRTATMVPHRFGRPVRRSRHVLEATAGAFARWGLEVGDVLALVDDSSLPMGPCGAAATGGAS